MTGQAAGPDQPLEGMGGTGRTPASPDRRRLVTTRKRLATNAAST